MEEALVLNAENARDLYVPHCIKRVETLSSVEFLRDYVSKNIPVIFTHLTCSWKALELWDIQYLVKKLGEKTVTVSQTPNGRADAILSMDTFDGPFLDDISKRFPEEVFTMPHEENMKFKDFIDLLSLCKQSPNSPVPYIQFQNSNLTSQFASLLDDIDCSSLSFAEEAFGCTPEAINFWMGENRSVSSLHKDHYENMYSVICGTKHFTLFPPSDRPFLRHESFQTSIFYPLEEDTSHTVEVEKMAQRKFGLRDLSEHSIPWIAVDPESPDIQRFPEYHNAKAISCDIHEGETLYLPSLYFHQVTQSEGKEGAVIAVNFWFDMQYDIKYNYFTLLNELSSLQAIKGARTNQ